MFYFVYKKGHCRNVSAFSSISAKYSSFGPPIIFPDYENILHFEENPREVFRKIVYHFENVYIM